MWTRTLVRTQTKSIISRMTNSPMMWYGLLFGSLHRPATGCNEAVRVAVDPSAVSTSCSPRLVTEAERQERVPSSSTCISPARFKFNVSNREASASANQEGGFAPPPADSCRIRSRAEYSTKLLGEVDIERGKLGPSETRASRHWWAGGESSFFWWESKCRGRMSNPRQNATRNGWTTTSTLNYGDMGCRICAFPLL